MDILLVHGYSETSLGAYFSFPERLRDALRERVDRIILAAFDSLDDTVTIDDLADAMETRVRGLENKGAFTTAGAAIICHSTGALITRRWILNRVTVGLPLPSHVVTIAGANHGSTLAQMGKSLLGYLEKLVIKHVPTVGARVLADLDYGSDFLLRLNREWMDCWNGGSFDNLYAFSLGGDSVGTDRALQVFWQTHEPGSDNTVRISGANLNYTLITAEHGFGGPDVVATRPKRPVPHLMLRGYSHFGAESGILGWVKPGSDEALQAVVDALSVSSADKYTALQAMWKNRVDAWTQEQRALKDGNGLSNVNSTIVFTIRDQSGRSIGDCMIAFLDQKQLGVQDNAVNPQAVERLIAATNAVSAAMLPHTPLHNDVQIGSYSFYIDYDEYVTTSPHWFHIEAALPTQLVGFVPLIFTQPSNLQHAIAPNEFTYVELTMKRDADDAYAMYGFGPSLNLAGTSWMPFPSPGRLTP